ncbi:MAG: hypothetical protein QMD71_09690, partial [bacterium]|nr:hypothetical protein [bacterium]
IPSSYKSIMQIGEVFNIFALIICGYKNIYSTKQKNEEGYEGFKLSVNYISQRYEFTYQSDVDFNRDIIDKTKELV